MKKYFIVTSHGWSASNWLAYALNLHPDIICTHSARNIQATEKSMNSNINLRQNLKNLHKGYVARQNCKIEKTYNSIEKLGEAKLYGSVHVYRLRDLPVLYEKYDKFRYRFNVINLVRHPISLVWSGYGQFKDLFRYDLNELHWTSGKILNTAREFIFKLALKYDLYIGDLENLAFLGAAAVLGSLRLDLNAIGRVKAIPEVNFLGHIQMEEITAKPEVLQHSIKNISDGSMKVNGEYLETVYATGIVNQHKDDVDKRDALARYNKFSDWQKETFHYFMKKYDLCKAYEQIDYDFSFID